MIDSHAHINDPAFDLDRKEVLQKSFDAGVKQIIEIACEADEWQPALDLCNQYPDIILAAAGVHPIYCAKFKEADTPVLEEVLSSPFIRAVGEIGLDYAWEHESPRNIQKKVFGDMLTLADKYKKPIVLHCRKSNEEQDYQAYDDMFAMLKEQTPAYSGVLHCFSGRYEDAVKALDMGLFLGINGIISYKKNNDLRETVKKIGLDYLLLETDCPYLPPQTKRGKRNDPSNIPEIAQTLADVLGVSLTQVDDVTSKSCKNLFQI